MRRASAARAYAASIANIDLINAELEQLAYELRKVSADARSSKWAAEQRPLRVTKAHEQWVKRRSDLSLIFALVFSTFAILHGTCFHTVVIVALVGLAATGMKTLVALTDSQAEQVRASDNATVAPQK